jgi:hypothetical protein
VSNAAWKDDERRVARRLGGERIALSGGRGAKSKGDVLFPGWLVEVKRRARFAFASWVSDVCLKAEREGRRGVVVVHVARTQGWCVLLDLRDFEYLVGQRTSDGVAVGDGEVK